MQEKDFSKIELKNNTGINVFGYGNVSDQEFEDSMNLLLLIDNDKSHCSTLKIFTDLCFTKQEVKTKNGSVKVFDSVLVAKII